MTRDMTYVETQMAQGAAADIVNSIDDFLEHWNQTVKPAIDALNEERPWAGDEPGEQFEETYLRGDPTAGEVMDAVVTELEGLRNLAILAGGSAAANEEIDVTVSDAFQPDEEPAG